MMKTERKRNAEMKASVLNSLSCARCMKNVATRPAFKVAMSIAIAMLASPKS